MAYRLDLGMWNQVFAVPCALVDRHLKLAGKEQLQVILFALRHAGESFGPGDLAAALGMTEDTALDALDYWTDRGLLALQGEELRPVPQPQEPPARPAPQAATAPQPAVESAAAQRAAAQSAASESAPAERQLPPKKRLLRPDGVHLAARLAESENVRFLMQEAETTLGKTLSPAMTSLLLTITDDYGLPVEVTVMLLHYAKEVGKTGTAYIDSVARDWAESNIFTLEAAEQKLQDLSQRRLAWGMVEAAAGLPKRSPSKKEEEAAFRWVYQWGFSREMLSAAYDRCADNTGKFSAAYMNKVLEGWHNAGIRSVDQLEEAEHRKKEEAAKDGKSYDIDELERLSFFNLPEEL